MKRKTKYFLLIVLSFVLMLSTCFGLVGCGKDPDVSTDNVQSVVTIAPRDDGLAKTEYKITVVLPDGSKAVGVEVLLYMSGDSEAYTAATTGADGVAVLSAAKGATYSVVLNRIPEGYDYVQNASLAANETQKTVYLDAMASGNVRYRLTVQSEGGMPLSGVSVSLLDGGVSVSTAITGETGLAVLRVEQQKAYSVALNGLPKGYSVEEGITVSADVLEQTVVAKSAVISEAMPKNHRYQMDDVIYDFSVTTSDGTTFTLSEALKTKKMVLINFWTTWCGPCRGEFDDMQRAYERYIDDVAIIALSPEDNNGSIASYKANYAAATLTFDMAYDSIGLYSTFSSYTSGYPTSIIVDRYGKICDYGVGGVTEATFRYEFGRFTDKSYVQSKYDPNASGDIPSVEPDKPDVSMPESNLIESAINNSNFTGTYSGVNSDTVWPWVIPQTSDGTNADYITASNIGHNNTTSIINLNFSIEVGQFLTFDYLLNVENIGGSDVLYVAIDGSEMMTLTRISEGYNEDASQAVWSTCYVFTPLKQGTHTLTLTYVKDNSDSYLEGTETVSIRDVRFTDVDDLQEGVDVLREAANDMTQMPDGGQNWSSYVDVVLGDDGVYHVGKKDGPYLLANISGETRWMSVSIGELAAADYLRIVGAGAVQSYITSGVSNAPESSYIESGKGYTFYADASAIGGYVLVDQMLREALDTIVYSFYNTTREDFKTKYYTEKTWLEICRYYDHYGPGKSIENPLIGLGEKFAIQANEGKNHVNVNKTLVPRGIVYSFVPNQSGAYRVYSQIPRELEQGGYVNITGNGVYKGDDAAQDFNVIVSFEKDKTYYISVAFDLPQNLGEYDFYIQPLGENYDEFTYAADGTYTYLLNPDGSFARDDDGNMIEIISRHNGVYAVLGEDGYYHQKGKDGKAEEGEYSFFYIQMTELNYLFSTATIADIVNGDATFEQMTGNPFDFTSIGGENYVETMKEYVAKAETEGERKGCVKADATLVNILTQMLNRIGHRVEDAWFNLAFYYEHYNA